MTPSTVATKYIIRHKGRGSQGSLDKNFHKSPQKVKRFWQRAKSGVFAGRKKNEFFAFLTLTSSPESPEEISKSWERLKKRIQRRFGRIEYIWVREFTQSGLLHMHVVIRGPYIPQKWLSQNWQEIHRAKIVHIEAIWNVEKAIRYMAKYLSKEIVGRFGYSWGWVFRRSGEVWRILCRSMLGNGYKLKDILKIWEFVMINMLGFNREKWKWRDMWVLIKLGLILT